MFTEHVIVVLMENNIYIYVYIFLSVYENQLQRLET